MADGLSLVSPSKDSNGSLDSPVPARCGRENQRYDEAGVRLTAGCVVRRGDEVLMISSSKDPEKFIIPKGGWETDETVEEAAARETLEEAGVKVSLGGMLGWFDCAPEGGGTKGKGTRLCAFRAECSQEMDIWAEGERKRVWMKKGDAVAKCRHHYMVAIIEKAFEGA